MVLPLIQIRAEAEEAHDTLADVRVPRALRRVQPRGDRAESTPRAQVISLPPPKRPIPAGEQLAGTRLSSLRIREAVVKRQTSVRSAPLAPPSTLPDVELAWIRGNDRVQRVVREGADGFTIRGAAAAKSRISLGVEGLIFTVEIAEGTTAPQAMELIRRRISAAYALVASSENSARLASHT